MSEKVKVSRDIYDSLIMLEDSYRNNDVVLSEFCMWRGKVKSFLPTLDHCYRVVNENMDIMTLAKILLTGYELEESPEQKLSKYYNNIRKMYKENNLTTDRYYRGLMDGIQITLSELNIKIEGIDFKNK